MLSVASVDSTVAYLIDKIYNKDQNIQSESLLQSFDLVIVYLQGQLPHHRTFPGPGKRFVLGCYENHLFEEFAERRCDFIGTVDKRPINTQFSLLLRARKVNGHIPN